MPDTPLIPGNIDLRKQPKVKNPDGSTSTVDSVGVNIDGKEYLLPTVTPDGRHFSGSLEEKARQASDEFRKTGRHLGVFDSPDASTHFAQQLHNDYAAGKYNMPDTYKISLSDGRVVTVESDHEPTEAEVLASLSPEDSAVETPKEHTLGQKAFESVIGGVKGLVRGAVSPITFPLKVAYDTVTKGPAETGKEALDAITSMPSQFMNGDAQKRAEMLGEVVGAGVGANDVAQGFPATKSAVRLGGHVVEQTATKGGWPLRMVGSHMLGSKNPLGLAMIAAPEMLAAAGRRMQQVGVPPRFNDLPVALQMDQLFKDEPLPDLSDTPMRPANARRGTPIQPEQTPFSQRPVYQQMEQTEGVVEPNRPLPQGGRSSLPVQPAQTPFHERPIYQQMMQDPSEPLTAPGGVRFRDAPDSAETAAIQEARSGVVAPKTVSRNISDEAVRQELRKMGVAEDKIDQAVIRPAVSHTPAPAAAPIRPVVSHEPTTPSTTSSPKTAVTDIPFSRTSREMSATPGLSVNDMKSMGLDPTINVKRLSPEVVQKILTERRARGMNYKDAAALESRLKALFGDENQ